MSFCCLTTHRQVQHNFAGILRSSITVFSMGQEKFRGKYRIASARLPGWDYATPAAYFVTVVTQNRHPFFGYIRNGVMHCSPLGRLAWDIWYLLPSQFPHCTLDAFVVMPDHIHGILVVGEPENLANAGHGCGDCRDAINRVSTIPSGLMANGKTPDGECIQSHPIPPNDDQIFTPSTVPGGITRHHNPMLLPHSLSCVMRWYKGRCTHDMRALRPDFGWQSRFYDRILRNEKALDTVRHYIETNPAR
jgi:putative transposase